MEAPLQVDHVIPKADGGGDDPENLAAACQKCNGGKSSIRLDESTIGVAPQAEAMRAHAQQVRDMLAAAAELKDAQENYISFAEEAFAERVCKLPREFKASMATILRLHPFSDIIEAADATATKVSQSRYMTASDAGRYFFGCLRNKRAGL